ncbi:PilW family protein [Undibacterium sp. CY18W]|uniref:PilW family protein n=1 Tax=Undibacterium hunanense TaxID=2762292 RepID=A0ABR6ZUY7_9BURK|nr:PilW family protein [Undibacterium hunanense]MBC3919668.1 PilW family protein [Undibacterium hunanense]
MKIHSSFLYRQKGLSIVELMIALTLGMIITVVAGSIFASGSKGYFVQQEQSQIQEAGRTAVDVFGRTVRTASDFGCRSDWTLVSLQGFVNRVTTSPPYAYNYGTNPLDTQVVGYDGTGTAWSPTIPSDLPIPTNADKNSDIVTIRGVTGNPAVVIAPFMTAVTDAVTVTTGNGFAANDVLVISDCIMSTIFQVSGTPDTTGTLTHAAGGSPGNIDNTLGKVYASGSEVYKLASTTFYIAPSQFSTNPSLWRIVGTNAAEELVENVERLKVYYGMDPSVGSDNTKRDYSPNTYIPANATGIDMSKVISLRFSMLIRSPSDNVTKAYQTYTFDGSATTATDYRLRSVFSTTISLRNRVL